MKNVKEVIGIDVSKDTLDLYLHSRKLHRKFGNNQAGFEQIVKWSIRQGMDLKQVLICFEHTGWYCLLLSYYLHKHGISYCCVNPMEIKHSMGLKRGKSDKIDAIAIARYAWLRREELIPSIPPPVNLIELQRLMSLRGQLVKHRSSLTSLKKGMQVLVKADQSDKALDAIKESIKHLNKQISIIEKEMYALVKSDDSMYKNYKLSISVKGVGKVVAMQILIHTHNFSRFSSWRQFSSYCGLVLKTINNSNYE